VDVFLSSSYPDHGVDECFFTGKNFRMNMLQKVQIVHIFDFVYVSIVVSKQMVA